MKPAAFGDRSWVWERARVLQELLFGNPERILLACGYQIAPWADFVAVSFCFNSVFCSLGAESDLKSGPL